MQFQTHPRYKYLAFASLILVGLFSWSLYQSYSGGSLFFLLVCLGACIWYIWGWFTTVRLADDRVELELPIGGRRSVRYQQIVTISESGRIGRSITLIYHPEQDSGLLDLDQVRSLNLPEVLDQHELIERLEARVPQ